jgi:hypothetical protein
VFAVGSVPHWLHACLCSRSLALHLTCGSLLWLRPGPVASAFAVWDHQLVSGGFPMHPVAKSTSLPEVHYPWLCWDEWVVVPVRIRDIPATAQLVSAFPLSGQDAGALHTPLAPPPPDSLPHPCSPPMPTLLNRWPRGWALLGRWGAGRVRGGRGQPDPVLHHDPGV